MTHITIPEDAWRENEALEAPETCLITTITVNGCDMHLEAWAVEDGPNGQDVVDADYAQSLSDLRVAVTADKPFYTTTIRGRSYILVATPFCQ